jgi:hypothetical protein
MPLRYTMSDMRKVSPTRVFLSTCGIVYVWSLPYLATIGFAEPGSTSISAFIANPRATGAMAAVSFMPLTLMWEYQDLIVAQSDSKKNYIILYYTLPMVQLFYGLFLTCTVGYVPTWVHSGTVFMFGTSFLAHSAVVCTSIQPNEITKIILGTGVGAFISLLFVTNMWFWAMECVGLTAMWSFTPIDWVLLSKKPPALPIGGATVTSKNTKLLTDNPILCD